MCAFTTRQFRRKNEIGKYTEDEEDLRQAAWALFPLVEENLRIIYLRK